ASAWRKSGRDPDSAGDEIPSHHQPGDGERAEADDSAIADGARGRADPVSVARYDMRDASFEDFVDFLFAHDLAPSPEGSWYRHVEVDYDPRRIASYYIRLFSAPRFLRSRFSQAQLEQGFWAILGGILGCSIGDVIWDRTVPFEVRADCVRSMT